MTAGRVGAAVGWAAVGGSLLVLLTQLIGTPSGAVAALQSLTPWALPPLLVVVGAAALRRRHRLADAGAAVLALHLGVLTTLALPRSGPTPDDAARPIALVTVNLLYRNDELDAVVDVLAGVDADVIAFAEVTERIAVGLIGSALADRYPHQVVEPGGGATGMMLWSRFPIAEHRGGVEIWRAIDVTVVTPDDDVRVLAVHPPPPVFDHATWEHDLEALASIVRDDGAPTVVLGDFNASWFHPPFRAALSDAELRDVVRETGDALDFTWPTDELFPPFVTLDHVLVDDRLAVIDADVVAIPDSDHHAVAATVALAADR